ncbi:predicted protein [Coccidioides posadasii str. Silveira]|uniref:Predicted protein n=1 Tax=Coccidioides posadasii (strain RMSCC 757 / Silveira) TaxID=443226 RepID=E9D0F7_COCPS|nr:predicted protein [Coccidioides posadasii str. Silveira]
MAQAPDVDLLVLPFVCPPGRATEPKKLPFETSNISPGWDGFQNMYGKAEEIHGETSRQQSEVVKIFQIRALAGPSSYILTLKVGKQGGWPRPLSGLARGWQEVDVTAFSDVNIAASLGLVLVGFRSGGPPGIRTSSRHIKSRPPLLSTWIWTAVSSQASSA